MSEWKEYKLSDLMEIKYGKDHKHLADGTYPLYGSGGVMRYVEKPLYEDESILIPRKGTLSNLFYLNVPFWSVDTMFWSKINRDLSLPKYLYYTLKTFDLASLNVGSAVPSLTTQVLNEVLISVPDLPTQIAIAEILSSLDDKIELNNQINKDLEALAQSLFKQWFIDFDFPNENGKPYRSSGGEMADSELGEIPKGWKTDRLGDHLYVKGRIGWKGLKKSDYLTYNTGYSIINGSDFSNEQIDWRKCGWISMERYEESPEIMLKEDDILITKDGTIGKIAFVNKLYSSTSVASGIFVVRVSSESLRTYFCWSFFKSPYFQELVKSRIDGSVIPHLYQRDFVEMFIPLPPVELLDKFENQSKLIFQNIFQNKEEAKDLEKLRDTLLPKLISGELKVTNNSIEV